MPIAPPAALLLLIPALSAAADRGGVHWDWSRVDDGSVIARAEFGGVTVPLTGTLEKEATVSVTPHGSLLNPGEAGFLRVRSLGPGGPLTSGGGDSFTLLATVYPKPIPSGRHAHLVCKGRTGNPGRPADNLNYAVRLTGTGGGRGHLSFLFHTGGGFHRWTSDDAVVCDGRPHRLAIAYTFGEPDSLRAYLDGRATGGVWDMGGATAKPPVTDDDDLWIGSAMGGSPGSTFPGRIGRLSLYRSILSESEMTRREPVVAPIPAYTTPETGVLVEVIADVPADAKRWNFPPPRGRDLYRQDAFGFPTIAHAYGDTGVREGRGRAFVVRASGRVTLPAGPWELLFRSRGGGRVLLDGAEVAATPFFNIRSSAHNPLRDVAVLHEPGLRDLRAGDREATSSFESGGKPVDLRVDFYVGGGKRRPETGETGLFLRRPGGTFRLVAPGAAPLPLAEPLTDAGWVRFRDRHEVAVRHLNAARRRAAAAAEDRYWADRHAAITRAFVPSVAVPAPTAGLPAVNAVDDFLNVRLAAAGVSPNDPADDAAFLRRLSLDVVGRIPTPDEIDRFLADPPATRRAAAVDRLLADDLGWADGWVAHWQDVLGENPSLVKGTLNNTGPFRDWLHEAFYDDLPADRFATELVRMRGVSHLGGPAGFGEATQNDAPFAAKAHVLAQAFLAADMTCARCHDAPSRPFLQRDLFGFAAMLKRGPQKVAPGSSLPPGMVGSAAVEVTLLPGTSVPPAFTLTDISGGGPDARFLSDPDDTRERLALLVTGPQNRRFAEVMVNRLWARHLGRGLHDTPHDWSFGEPSHPDLLAHLADELVRGGYDLKRVARLILTSHAYGREPAENYESAALFAGPTRRRMTAEQVIDSLFTACGKRFKAGQLTLDADGAMAADTGAHFGRPRRAWQFASLSSDRDRQSLTLPRAEPFVDVLAAFGWRSTRPDPRHDRDHAPAVTQPGLLANGVLGRRFTRLSDDSRFTAFAVDDLTLDELAEHTVRAVFTRLTTAAERTLFREMLGDGYESRRSGAGPNPPHFYRHTGVSWSNHFDPESARRQIALKKEVEAGDPPTPRLTPDWRERYEDVLWVLLNSPEFVFVP